MILIDRKFIKKMYKKYLNIMKILKLDQILASAQVDINNWSLRNPKQRSQLIEIFSKQAQNMCIAAKVEQRQTNSNKF